MNISNTSTKLNVIYNILLTGISYITGFITYPYISRVLGVENIGIISFVDQTINSFLLFATLGIGVVGVRAIAISENKKQLEKTFSSLISALVISHFIIIILYLIVILVVQNYSPYRTYLYIGLTRMISSIFMVEWFFQGTSNFKYVTIRSVIIRIISIVLIFSFVKNAEDITIYYIICCGTAIVNAAVNWIMTQRELTFSFDFSGSRKYLTPMIIFGIYSILNATFSSFNYLFLGFLCSDIDTGYYATADKLYSIILSAISAFTAVMLPKMSSLAIKDDKNDFALLIEKSFSLILAFCFPLATFGSFFAEDIVQLIAGNGYEGAILPLRIMMILVLVNGINQIFIMQIAIPLKLDKYITIGTAIAAIVSILLNFILIRKFAAVGSSIVLVISVLLANVLPILVIIKRYNYLVPFKKIIVSLIRSVPYVLIAVLIKFTCSQGIFSFIFAGVCFFLYFLLINNRLFKVYLKKFDNE